MVGLNYLKKQVKILNKMMNRSKENRVIGGVCGGLGEWSEIPPILWRIGFLFFIPAAFWVYLALWVLLKKQ